MSDDDVRQDIRWFGIGARVLTALAIVGAVALLAWPR